MRKRKKGVRIARLRVYDPHHGKQFWIETNLGGVAGISRREGLALLAALVVLTGSGGAEAKQSRFAPAVPFSWDWLVAAAKARAARAYVPPAVSTRRAADFDDAVRRSYAEADRLAGLVRLMPVTPFASIPVGIHVVEAGQARKVQSLDGLFGGHELLQPAGFRILHEKLLGDWIAFAGASYFRAAGSRNQYGLSARGIAVDTGLPRPEEFPGFTDFWIEAVGPSHFMIHALLDGPSLTGAFAFDCRFDDGGVTQGVQSTLFLRQDIERLGIAPATSMFWYDQTERRAATDWRPEIHDSDGLAILTGSGERIWRPLTNPAGARANSFRADGLKGFGLIQRDQRFEDYQDDGIFYDRRPSLWIEPQGDWGPGSVFLFEIPTAGETDDNIVAFWLSDQPARAGERRDFRYTLRWTSNDPSSSSAARVVDGWTGTAGIPGKPPIPGARKYVIDFSGPSLVGLDRKSGVEPVVNIAKPALLALAAYPVVDQPDRWRVMLDIRPDATTAKELRLFLRLGTSALSETLIEPLSS